MGAEATPTERSEMAHDVARAAMQANPPAMPPAPPPDLLDRVFAKWPDMERYRSSATVERIDYWQASAWRWCWCVTINV